MKFNNINEKIIDELTRIVGNKNIITDKEKMESYSHDETPPQYAHMPEVVVIPKNAGEISRIIKIANNMLIPITPRGGGTGLSGGSIPVFGGIVLSLEKMNKIIEIDRENMMITVEPGVITSDINTAIEDFGLFYAGYPMSVESCFIGGNIAEDAGGGRAVKYGVTHRYVMGLEIVSPTGEIIQLGGKLVKDVTGYNLKQLIVGSEGTLGVVTKIILKLIPIPKYTVDLLVLFKDPEFAIKLVPKIMVEGGLIPTSIEYMDYLSVKTTCEYLNEKLPYKDAGAMLLIEFDGNRLEQVEADYEFVGDLCLQNEAFEVYVADNYTTRERIWSVRRNIDEALRVLSPVQTDEDIVVPIASISELCKGIANIACKYNILIPNFGHAGDGNFHPTLLKNPNSSMGEWYKIEEQALTDIYKLCNRLGGKITGEHGIGCKRKKYLNIVTSQLEIEFMKKIKKALDPNYILNPGKIFDL
jgi:glycolate oxidase